MGISIETLAAAKKFTSETVLGGGAVVGKNVTISSITPIEGGNRVTFSYTLDNGTVKTSTMDVMNGVDGIDGLSGKDGKDGQPGKDGSDGIGISKIEKISTVDLVDTYRITFTDNSTFDYEVTNGKDGQGGTGGSAGGASNVYSTEETAIGTWIDGKTIYRKVIEYGKLASISNSGDHGKATVNFEEPFGMVIRMTALLVNSKGTFHQIIDASNEQAILVPSTSISTYVKEVEDNKAYINSATNTNISLWYGKNYGGYNCTFIVEYTKSA